MILTYVFPFTTSSAKQKALIWARPMTVVTVVFYWMKSNGASSESEVLKTTVTNSQRSISSQNNCARNDHVDFVSFQALDGQK